MTKTQRPPRQPKDLKAFRYHVALGIEKGGFTVKEAKRQANIIHANFECFWEDCLTPAEKAHAKVSRKAMKEYRQKIWDIYMEYRRAVIRGARGENTSVNWQ